MNIESMSQLAKGHQKPPAEQPEKSQAEIRAEYEARFWSLKPQYEAGVEAYKQALKDGTFEDKEGEESGGGEKRKEAMQKKLTAIVDKAEVMKVKLDSGEELELETPLDLESLKADFTPFLHETWQKWNVDADKIKNAVITPILSDPKTENYADRQVDIDVTKFGEFTLNPDTQNLDWETLKDKIFIPDPQEFTDCTTVKDVADRILQKYAGKYQLPGLEYWKFMIQNPDKVPTQLKDGNYYFNFGSLVRHSDGSWGVPSARWGGSEWLRDAFWLDFSWDSSDRVVLLKI